MIYPLHWGDNVSYWKKDMREFELTFETIDAYILYVLVTNLPLILISFGMIFFVIYGNRLRNHIARYSFAVIITSLVLALFNFLKELFRISANYGINLGPVGFRAFLVNFFGLSGYVLRPLALFFFIKLAEDKKDKKSLNDWWFTGALILCAIVYMLGAIPGVRDIVVYWGVDENANIHFVAGGFLRYTAHVISALFLAYLIFLSSKKIKAKHIEDAAIIIALSVFAIISVIIESEYSVDFLVNTTIAISCVFYYLFIHNQSSKKDALTRLYSRATYYDDVIRFNKNIVAVIELDMNGLKYLNDNHGHEAGDMALISLAQIVNKNIDPKQMFAYRLGGDEFLVLVLKATPENVKNICDNIHNDLKETDYSCSVGWAHRDNLEGEVDIAALVKEAEKQMYLDKEAFYKNSTMERRKANR